MKIKVPISIGELVDKITILHIKIEKMEDSKKLIQAKKEARYLEKALYDNIEKDSEFKSLFEKLADVNLELWNIEDDIRKKESNNLFDLSFVELARSVYKINDLRFKIKSEINTLYKSEIIEVKEHHKY